MLLVSRIAVKILSSVVAQAVVKFIGRAFNRVMAETVDVSESTYTTPERARTVQKTAVLSLKHLAFELVRSAPVRKLISSLDAVIPFWVVDLLDEFIESLYTDFSTLFEGYIDGLTSATEARLV